MRILLQRVSEARVEVAREVAGKIGRGLLLFVGIKAGDTRKDADYLADKVVNLRIFPDELGRMNRSVQDTGGGLLVVSQFTLYGDCRKGRRPGFDEAAPPDVARELYEYLNVRLRNSNLDVQTGVFQADMQVYLINDGPVTFLLDSNRV